VEPAIETSALWDVHEGRNCTRQAGLVQQAGAEGGKAALGMIMINHLGPVLRVPIIALMCFLFTSTIWASSAPYSFRAFLVEGYGALANAAQETGNEERTSFFRHREAMADSGKAIDPATTEENSFHHPASREAAFARAQLLKTLEDGARERQPLLAAIAQVNFDCWVAPPRRPSADSEECRRRFYLAFVGLKAGSPAIAHSIATPPSSGAPVESLDPSTVQLAYASGLRPEIPKPTTAKNVAAPPLAEQAANANASPGGIITKRVNKTSLGTADEPMWRRLMAAIEKLW
jgi:hypothetical protein